MSEIHTVTGAFGYSGKYIAKRLLQQGFEVQTLTNSVNRPNPFEGKVRPHYFNFDQPKKLIHTLEGTKVLYNTYWVRFKHKGFSHSLAVHNLKILFQAARSAGVERIVHTSITNPSLQSPLEYFSGKAEVEEALKKSGLSYAILRPAVLFGPEDILINNIAWLLRCLPVFGMFGRGLYKLQPIYVDDYAKLAVEQGKAQANNVIDAIGPETFTYRELVFQIARLLGKRRLIMPLPLRLGYCIANIVSYLKKDLTITWDEIIGLTNNLLFTRSAPTGNTRLTGWIKNHKDSLGIYYANELSRRHNLDMAYESINRKSL